MPQQSTQQVHLGFSLHDFGQRSCCSVLPEALHETLHLSGFANVTLDDYRSILALESEAVEAGYPQLK